jgi:2-hydroxychromene-2-carboxylate isomerase
MAREARMDFWFSIGSTYSYLTVMRLPALAQRHGVGVRWRPFNVRHVMVSQNNIPFKDKPVKAAYMWRDIARRASALGLVPRLPAPYPLPELERANLVALLGMDEGWGQVYVREAYRLWFEEGLPAGEEPNLSRALSVAGQDHGPALARAAAPEVAQTLDATTQEAMALGVFGAPSFVVGEEVFWGDDRLEDALSWQVQGRVLL